MSEGQPPALTASAVHVWLFASDMPPSPYEELFACLDAPERDRASRFHFERDRLRFVAARASLRRLLGMYTQRPAAELRFIHKPSGKPQLDSGVGPPFVSFNLAHSGGWALVGVTAGAPIGVDLEKLRDIPEHEDIARRHFAPAEIEILSRLLAVDRAEGFLASWTLKEAFLKAIGDGLLAPLSRFDVLSDPGFVRRVAPSERVAGWRSLRLRPAPAIVAALAVQIGRPELTCFGFRSG
jgi:4'-phosphopantetheinyl transferase